LCIVYYINFINAFVFIGSLLFELIVILCLLIIYRNDKVIKRRFILAKVIVSLLIVYEYRLIHYDSYTYIVNSAAEPVEVLKDSGIHILVVNSFEILHIKDEKLIKDSYERQFQPVISLYKITNKDRYLSKTSELQRIIGFKQGDFEIMRKNVIEYLESDVESIDTFLNREDIQGDSAGLGLALTALIGQSKIQNNLIFGVTGALNSSGDVLKIGSIKEKMIISEQNEFPFIILPTSNAQDAEIVKVEQKLNIEIIPVSHIDQAIKVICELNENNKY
jgi:hypothetical protein